MWSKSTGIRKTRLPIWVRTNCRVIIAIRKHIEPSEALASAAVGIGVEEALHGGVIISALEIIEAGFFGLSVAIEAKKRS